MILTRRGLGVLVGSLVSYGLGATLGIPLLIALATVGLVAVVAAVVMVFRRPRFEVERSIDPVRVTVGDQALGVLRVRNDGARTNPTIWATEPCGTTLVDMAIPRLRPEGSTIVSYELPTDRRGALDIGPLSFGQRGSLPPRVTAPTGRFGRTLLGAPAQPRPRRATDRCAQEPRRTGP